MASRSRSRIPREETVHPIPSTVPQQFPISQPLVYLQANDQAAFDAALATFNNELARLRNTNTFNGEGWVRDPDTNHAYMIQAPALPPAPNGPDPAHVSIETREERRERFNQARDEALQRAANAPRRTRERPSRPQGHIDRRNQQRHQVEQRRLTRLAYQQANPAPPRPSQRNRSLPSTNIPLTRARRREMEAERAANQEFYVSESMESWEVRVPGRIDGWRQDVAQIEEWRRGVEPEDEDTEMEDVQDLGSERSEVLPGDAVEGVRCISSGGSGGSDGLGGYESSLGPMDAVDRYQYR
ncbi:MAG: hypothetical protein Q9221_002069 [Calogaya cf. arnoldii]